MKKIVLSLAVLFSMTMVSCNNAETAKQEGEQAATEAVEKNAAEDKAKEEINAAKDKAVDELTKALKK